MTERERERILKISLFGLLGFVGVWLYVWPMIDGFLFGEIRERNQRVADLETEVLEEEARMRQAKFDERKTGLWKSLSLPPDPLAAQRLYQQWLTDLVVRLGFEAPEVKPGQRVPHKGIYTTVVVTVEADATYDTIVRFLFHAQRTSLMHRIAKLDLVATGTSPSDPVRVTITAEGFSFAKANARPDLVPTTELVEPLASGADTMLVDEAKGFPSSPGFEVRIGGEFARVTEIDGTRWTLERGLHRSRAAVHDAGDDVELVRLQDAWKDVSLADYEEFVKRNPFAKPRVYTPSVSPVRDQTIAYGETARFSIRASGYDPAKGDPTMKLVHGADVGMKFDPEKGDFSWTPGADAAAGEYEGMIEVTFPGIEKPVERWFGITIRRENEPPVVAAVETMTVAQGAAMTFQASATDPEETAIRYSLNDAPRGASIDPETGVFTWEVATDYEPGLIEFDVVATDADRGRGLRAVQIDILESGDKNTFLVGSYERDGERWAWLYDEKNKEKIALREGTEATINGADVFVLVIGRDFVLYVRDETTYRLDLGKALDQVRAQ